MPKQTSGQLFNTVWRPRASGRSHQAPEFWLEPSLLRANTVDERPESLDFACALKTCKGGAFAFGLGPLQLLATVYRMPYKTKAAVTVGCGPRDFMCHGLCIVYCQAVTHVHLA